MRHALKIATGIDTVPILSALQTHAVLWNENRLRKDYPGSPHSEVDDIWLRFNLAEGGVVDDCECVWFDGGFMLPSARHLLFWLMARVEGERLGRCLITRLAPGKRIPPHADQGAPVEYYSRYQFALQTFPGCSLYVGDETIEMQTGDVWRFDNSQVHSVLNNSSDDRIVMIADIRSPTIDLKRAR